MEVPRWCTSLMRRSVHGRVSSQSILVIFSGLDDGGWDSDPRLDRGCSFGREKPFTDGLTDHRIDSSDEFPDG